MRRQTQSGQALQQRKEKKMPLAVSGIANRQAAFAKKAEIGFLGRQSMVARVGNDIGGAPLGHTLCRMQILRLLTAWS